MRLFDAITHARNIYAKITKFTYISYPDIVVVSVFEKLDFNFGIMACLG